MPAGKEAIPEVMDYGEEIVRVGENLDVLPLKHELESAHPRDVGVSGKLDGFPITNSSNGSFHKQSEENQTSVDEINGNKEDEQGTSPEQSKDTSHIEEETNNPRIESLPLIPEARHIVYEMGEPLIEELYPHPSSDVKEVETTPELLVPEIFSGRDIDMEEVNEDVRVGLVEPSIEQETIMGEKYEATEDMKYEEQEIITYRGRGLVEEGYQGSLPKDGLQTENIMQAKELKEKNDSVFVEESKGVEEGEVNDLVEVATEPQIIEGSSPEEKIDVELTKNGENTMKNITWSGEVVSEITNVGDDSMNYLASVDVSGFRETRDDNADAIGEGVSQEEEVLGDVTNDRLSKDRELTSTEMGTEETGFPEPEAPSHDDSVSHPETEQQCPNPEASLVKEDAEASEAVLADATGEITEQVTFKQDNVPTDSNVYQEIFHNNQDEDPSSGKPDLISESYAEPVKEVNEAEDKGNRVTEKGTNTKREHDPVPELTQYEFQPNVAEEEFPSSAMASNEPDIIQEDDKSSGFVISEDVEEKSYVSFKEADTIPRGDDDVEAHFVKDDNNADTTKEVTEESAKKTDQVSHPIETGEVVEEKDVSFVQAATIPHGDDDAEAYVVKDDDADLTKEVTEESATKTDDASGPLETNVQIVEDSSEDFTLQETQGIHPEQENLPEASIPSSEEVHSVEKVSRNGNDNVAEDASEEVLSTAESQTLDVPSASLEVELEPEETGAGENVCSHPGVSPRTDAANEVRETRTVEAQEVLEEGKLGVHQRSAELDTEISSTVPENSNIDEQVAFNEDSENCEGTTSEATVPTGSKIQEEVAEGITALGLDEAPKQLEVLEETETSAGDAANESFKQREIEVRSKQPSEIADQGDDADTKREVTEECAKETDDVSSPLETDVPIVADSAEDFTQQETQETHPGRENLPEASILSMEEEHFVEKVAKNENDNVMEHASEAVLSTVENQPLDVPSASLEVKLESDEAGIGEDVFSHPGVLPLTDAANEVSETQTEEAPVVLEEEKLERSAELDTEISSTVPEDSNIDEQVATNEDSNCEGTPAAAMLPKGSKIQEEVAESISALELDETAKQVEVLEENETSDRDAMNENFEQPETEASSKQPSEIADQGDDTDPTKEVAEESAKKTDYASGPLETDVQNSSEDFTLQETQGTHPERENLPETCIPSSEEVDFVEKVAKTGNDNDTEYASEEALSTIENQPLDIPSVSLEVELESDETGIGEDMRSHPGVLPLPDAANEVSETRTVEAPEVSEEEKLERSAELGTGISSTVPEDSNIDEQVATNEDSNCEGTTAAATLPKGSKIQEEVAEGISALELDETPKQVEVLEETETSAGYATNENFEQLETEAGSKQPSEIADQGYTMQTEVPGESIKQVAVDTALPSIDLQDSRSDDQSVSTEAPKYEGISAAEVVTKRETPEEDILSGSFSGDAEAQIGSSEFSETPKIPGIQEHIVHSEDVQDSVSGISNETPAGSEIANDKNSIDIVEKDLIDGTENDEKIDAAEVDVEAKDISSREVSFAGEQGTEVITNDQTALVDQIEERKEILDSNDQKGDAIKYDTHSEIEEADDHQVSVNEASVEQSTEEEAAVEVDTNVVLSTEMGITDAEHTQISRSIDAGSSEERHFSSTENIESKDLNEQVAESKEVVDVKEASYEAPLVESAVVEESIPDQTIGTGTLHKPDTLLVPTEENEVKDQEGQPSEVTDSFPGERERDMEEKLSYPEQRDLPSELEKTQNLSAADGADISETTIMLEGDIHEAESQELSTSDLTNEAEHDEKKVQEDDGLTLANTGPAANEVPENPSEETTLSEDHQLVEEPAVSQGDTSSSLMEDNNNEDKKGIVRPSEFLDETDSGLEIKEDNAHFEDVQDGNTGIIDETPSGSVIAKDGDSTDIMEKDLIDGTKNDEKISTREVTLDTKNIDSRELEQDEQLVGESSDYQVRITGTSESEMGFEVEQSAGLILSDQTSVADQIEEESKKILDSDYQNGKAIEYTTPGETADSDNHQTKISEALVEETEEKPTVEFDRNVVLGTETCADDTESTQISQGIVTESSEESNPTTDNVESKYLTDEVTETEEIINEKETSEDAAHSHSELVESAVAEENIYDESTRKETSHEQDSLLVPEEIEVKDREAPSSEAPDSFSEKQVTGVEQEVSRPEQTGLVSSEVETNQIFSKAEDVGPTVDTITPEGDNWEAETRDIDNSDQTKEEEHTENKIQEEDSSGIVSTDLRTSEDAEIPMGGGSAISEAHQYVEEPVLGQGDTDASLVDENINKDERDAVGSSLFRDLTNSIEMINEDVLQTKDIQNIESDIINEAPAGTGLAEDKGSAETVAKDVINGMESEAKVDLGEESSETTNIDTREFEQHEQQVGEAASDLQVGLSGTPEAEPSFEVEQVMGVIAADQTVAINQTAEESKEIPDSDDHNGEATKYTAQGATANADDRRASINEDLVEQTTEEKSVMEVGSNVISGTETSTVDTASAQISRDIDAESFEERNSTAGNIENKEFFDEEEKYSDESKDQAEEVTKSEEIIDAKETSKEASLANSELVATAVAEEGILDQSMGTKISHEHDDSSLVLPEENEAKDWEVPSGVGSDDSVKLEQHVEERDLLASEFEKTQTAEIPELSTPDQTKDEVSVENRVETLESEGIRGLPVEDDQREVTQGVFVEEVASEKEITSKDAEGDRIIQEDEAGHKEAENSIEAKEDEANKDGELKDFDEVETESSVIVEETVAAATPATETEDLENKGSYSVADSSLLEAVEGEKKDINLSSTIVEEAHSYGAGADSPFSERSISDIPPGIQGEILDGQNAGELNPAAVSVEDISGKEEELVDSESREVEAIGKTEVSDEAALPNAPHEPATTLQTQPTDDSYQKDSVELTEENKVNIEGETADDSMIESYGENEREIQDKTSNEQSSQVLIDCNDLGADAQTRDVPATAENAKIDQSESVEKVTRSSDIGELEQIQSPDLQDQVDNSVPPEAEDGGNESTEVLLKEVETKEGSSEEAQQFAQSMEITSDGPSDQKSDFSASVADVVLEKEIHETEPSEKDQMSRTIQEVSECTDVDGVAAVDTEADIMKDAQPTQRADDLTEEDTGQMSATVVPYENDKSKEQSSTADNQTTSEKSLELNDRQVEPYPAGEVEIVDIEDFKSASIGESPLDQNPPAEVSQESPLLQVSEKELGNEGVQSSAMDEVRDFGNEPTVHTDISQDDLDIGSAKSELGDRDFTSAVQAKEISTEEATSKINEVVSDNAVESIDDNIRETAPKNSDTRLSMSSEILDGDNAGEHNSADVSVEDICKEEDTDGIEGISKEFSDKSVLSDITNEVAMRIQTEQADDSYGLDSTELAKESKLHVESMPVDGSTIEFYRENDQDVKDETSNDPVLTDNQEPAVDMTTRDIQETTENVEIDKKVELDEHTTSAVVGEVEQYQSQELNASDAAFLQADQIDSSLPSEAKAETNKVENKEALVEEGLPSDGPSYQISTLSTGELDNVQEPETREVATSEDDRAKGTIKEEIDDESRNRVEQEDIAEKVEQEFPSNEERPVIGESVEEMKPLDELTQSIEEESNDCKGGENLSEVIKDVYTDTGVAVADTEEGVEEATQPTQTTGEEESIREMSTSITPDENDDLEKEGFVEPTPREEAMPKEIVDVPPASVGESITDFSKEEPTLLHVSEKDAGNEDLQPVVMNDAWSVGTEPVSESDVGQEESCTGGSKSADKERDIKATQLELPDRDFTPAVPTKDILEVDATKIEEVESLGAGVAANEEAREDSGHAAGKAKDRVQIYEDESSASESIIKSETIIPHGEAEVSKSVDGTTEEVIPRTLDSAMVEKVDVLGDEIEYENEVSSLGINQSNLPDVTNLEDTGVKEITMDVLSTDGQAAPGAASEETVAEMIHFASNTDRNTDGEKTTLPLPLEEREQAPGDKRVEETGTGGDTAEKCIESRNLDFMSPQADQETQSEINIGETLSDGYLVDKADYEPESAAVENAGKAELPIKGTEEEAFDKDQMLLEKALENKDEYKTGATEEGKFPILSEANDSVEKIVDPTPPEKVEEQNIDGIEGEYADIKAETPIPIVQGSSEEIFKGDQTRTLEEPKGTNRAILSEWDAPTAYQDARPQEVVSPAKEFTQDLPGTPERGLPHAEARESGDQSEVKLVSREFEGEKYEPGNLQLPEDHEYDDHEHVEHSDAAPLISESSKETLDGKSHKKSHHNLLSGMSSKVKSSISKVKKVITGKSSSHGKEHSPKHGQ